MTLAMHVQHGFIYYMALGGYFVLIQKKNFTPLWTNAYSLIPVWIAKKKKTVKKEILLA